MKSRKNESDVETGIETLSREGSGGLPVYGSTGVRHEGGVILIQAWVRNVGTCRSDAKGEAQGANGVRLWLFDYGNSMVMPLRASSAAP